MLRTARCCCSAWLSIVASLVLARRMVTPIRALQAGAERIGAGELSHQIEVRTGDELEALGESFNSMTAACESRTKAGAEGRGAHARSVGGAGAADGDRRDPARHRLARPPTLEPVLDAVAERAARLCDAY